MCYALRASRKPSPPTRSSGIMIIQVLHCPNCQGTDVVRHVQTRQGKQRYRCRELRCAGRTFLLDYSYRGQSPAVKEQIVEMALHASGIRDTARVLHVSTNTVMAERKKRPLISTRETMPSYRSCTLSTSRWRCAAPRHWMTGVGCPPSWTKCEVSCIVKRTHAGYGTRLIIAAGPCLRTCLGDGRIPCFSS